MKKMVIVTLVIAFLAASVVPVVAIDLNTAKNEKSSIDNRINDLKSAQREALEKKAKLERQKTQVAKAQADERNAYDQLVIRINDAEENLRQIEEALAEAVADYNEKRELFKTRLRVMYQNTSATKLDILLESQSLVEFYERLHYMSVISRNDTSIVEDLNDAKQDVEYKKQLQQQAKELLNQEASGKQERLAKLKASRAALESELARSKAALAKLEKDIDAQIAKSKELNEIIKNLSRASRKYAGGIMIWPCPSSYDITSDFGMRKHPVLRKVKMHTGIDIGGSSGNSIVAANKGTVIMAQYDRSGGYGRMVVIDHGGGITTLYAHASKLLVGVGDEVKAGQTIAKVGSTGLSTGPHLHFEVRKDGEPKNPLSGYLGK